MNSNMSLGSDSQPFSRNVFTISWLRFYVVVFILLTIGCTLAYFFSIYFPLILVAVWIGIWGAVRFRQQQKLQQLNQLKLPDYIWSTFHKRHPAVHARMYPVIEEGFKDYLAIHLWKRNAYAMPSSSVDALWHLLLEEYELFYAEMCQRILGYVLIHKPHETNPTVMQRVYQKKQLANTWQGTCWIHGLNPHAAQVLPRLFQVDQLTRWENGLIFSLPVLMAMFSQMAGMSVSVTEHDPESGSSCASSTTSCTGSGSHMESDTSSSDGNSSDSGSDSSSSCSSCGGGGGSD